MKMVNAFLSALDVVPSSFACRSHYVKGVLVRSVLKSCFGGCCRFCQMHKQVKGFSINPGTLKNQQAMKHPVLGEYSVLVLAAAVAHQVEVVAPPRLWGSIVVNQTAVVAPSPESCSMEEEYGTPALQRSSSGKKVGAQVHSDVKLVETGPFVNPKPAARRSQGFLLSRFK